MLNFLGKALVGGTLGYIVARVLMQPEVAVRLQTLTENATNIVLAKVAEVKERIAQEQAQAQPTGEGRTSPWPSQTQN